MVTLINKRVAVRYTLSSDYGQSFLKDSARMRNVERAMPERLAASDVEMTPFAHRVYVSGKFWGSGRGA